jgi:hypothetical protein
MPPMDELRLAVAEAIRKVRGQVRWKPGKDIVHLKKRQAMGHLAADANLTEYNAVIQTIVGDPNARVFAYRVSETVYVVMHATVQGRAWLAIFGLAGIMETAFPPDDIDGYLAQPGFSEVGPVEELQA